MSKKGLFLTVDGVDGCGKTTVCDTLQGLIRDAGCSVEVIPALGQGMVGKVVRERWLEDGAEYTLLERTMGIAASVIEAREYAKRRVDAGVTVVMDRYISTFYAYQCVAFDYPAARLVFNNILTAPEFVSIHPDIQIFCSIQPEVGTQRIQSREKQNWVDHVPLATKQKMVKGFKEYFQKHCRNSIVCSVNANLSLDSVQHDITSLFHEIIKPKL